MQKLAIGLIVLAVVVGGFYLVNGYIYNAKQGDTPERGVVSGVVVSVNRDPLAYDGPAEITVQDDDRHTHRVLIPARLNICAAFENIADVYALEAGDRVLVTGDVDPESAAITPCTSPEHYFRVMKVVTEHELGFTFEYREGPNGYVLQTVPPSADDPDRVYAVGLMLQTDYDELMAATDAREGPPSMNVTVYKNSSGISAREWASMNPSLSNIGLVTGAVSDTSVAGAAAVRYLVDGLYPTDTVAVSHGDFIYLISGSYLEAGSDIHRDFAPLLESVRFTAE